MRAKATFVMVDDKPTFILEDGSIIDADKIGYIAHNYGQHPEDCMYDKFTKSDIDFILNNNIDCEIEMVDNFGSGDAMDNLYDGERVPKLYRGKVIIHFN